VCEHGCWLGEGSFGGTKFSALPRTERQNPVGRSDPPTGFCFGGATFRPMNRAQLERHLAQANRHIAEVKAHITRQRAIVKRGHLSELSETTLLLFEESLRIFEKHRELILDQLKRP